MTVMTAKVSQKGQVVIPAAIRKAQNIKTGTKLSFEVEDDEIIIKKVPSNLNWDKLIKDIPNEKAEFDQKGHYDAAQAPHFDEWMKENE